MPKGQQQKIKGAICNISVQAQAVSTTLPRGMDSNGLILVKLKRKIEFLGHVYFESVRPDSVRDALEHLKNINPFYSNIFINMDNVSKELLSLSDIEGVVDQDEFPIEI